MAERLFSLSHYKECVSQFKWNYRELTVSYTNQQAVFKLSEPDFLMSHNIITKSSIKRR